MDGPTRRRFDSHIPPGAQIHGKIHTIGQFKNGSTRTVAKQHAGVAVGHIHQARKLFTPDHQRIAAGILRPGSQQTAGHRRSVDKPGTGGVYIQHRDILGKTQFTLNQTGGTGGSIGTRKRGADTATDLFRLQAAAFQRLTGCRDSQSGRGLPFRAEMPLPDAGARGNPFVAGIHQLAQIFVGHHTAGQRPAGGNQLQTFHKLPRSVVCHRPIWRYFLYRWSANALPFILHSWVRCRSRAASSAANSA